MAEEKKSIIVYADWIKKFEELEDDEAGRLIKHFFRYVNDLNPTPPDRTTKLMFIDIEASLKRDLKKWDLIKSKRSEAGKASAEAKKLAKEQEEKIKQNQTKSTSVEIIQQNSTKSTVSVNDNVSVSVNDNVNEINIQQKDVCDFENLKTELIHSLCESFGFSEMRFADKQRIITAFVNCKILNRSDYENFIEQFKCYKEYKKLTGEKEHSFYGFFGKQSESFKDAGWDAENWKAKLEIKSPLRTKPKLQF